MAALPGTSGTSSSRGTAAGGSCTGAATTPPPRPTSGPARPTQPRGWERRSSAQAVANSRAACCTLA